MKHEEITHQIIGSAYTVFKKLGFGFLESVYKKAMTIELNKSNLKVVPEKQLKVYYDEHEVQLVNYLNGLKKEIGLLINFGPSGVEVKRKYRRPIAKT